MIAQVRAQLRLLHEVLEHDTKAVAIVARRDIGLLHDELAKAEVFLATVPIELIHELKKTFTETTPKTLREQVDAIIKAVDEVRKQHKMPPSSCIEEPVVKEAPVPAEPKPVLEVPAAVAAPAPVPAPDNVVPFAPEAAAVAVPTPDPAAV